MENAADYTILVLLVVLGAALWTLLERVGQIQRDLDEVKRRLGAEAPPAQD
jgi:hypothetical protein